MFETPDTRQSAELTPEPAAAPYGRDNYGKKMSEQIRTRDNRPIKTPSANSDPRSRPVYLCPELGRTCMRPGAYDAFDLPSLIGDTRRPHRFQD